MTTNFVQRGTEIIKAAVDKDNADELDAALNLYSRGIEFLMTGMKYEKNPRIIAAIRDKVNKYFDRAETIKQTLNSQKPKTKNKQKKRTPKRVENTDERKTSATNNDDDDEAQPEDEDTAKLKGSLAQSIVIEKPNVKWEDIGGLQVAKCLLQETVILPIRFPHLFTGNRKPCQGILLYGPPGTGKSYLAKAVATEAHNSTFFSVSSSDLTSKFVGESEKLVRQLFTLAREKKPSIIFIDEIDSLAGKRGNDGGSSGDSSRRLLSEFLVQMNGVATDGADSQRGVLTLGATNCPWDLDPAIRRRFAKRIYIPLPDEQARERMFRIHIGDGKSSRSNPHLLNEQDFALLAKKTEGYSGSDISGIVQDALMEPIRTMQSATHFKKVFGKKNVSGKEEKKDDEDEDDYVLVPCSPNDPKGMEMTLLQIGKEDDAKVRAEPLQLVHFLRILKSSKPSVGKGDLQRQIEWTKEFGQEGS